MKKPIALSLVILVFAFSSFAQNTKVRMPVLNDSVLIKNDNLPNIQYQNNPKQNQSCLPPENFSVEVDTTGEDLYQLNFSWQIDEPNQGWIHWDDGVYAGGVGTCPPCDLYAAARWDAGQLDAFAGFQIVEIDAVLHDDSYKDLFFNIWTGEHASNHIYDTPTDTVVYGGWINHHIDTTLYIETGVEYWFGYNLLQYKTGYPLGYDNGPAIPGYGDMISTDGVGWDRISEMGIDNNFVIHIFLADSSGNKIQVGELKNKRSDHLLGYNLYQSIDGNDYQLLEFIPWLLGDTSHSIPFEANPSSNCFQLTAIWATETDTCESAPAISKENPDEDFVCLLLVGEEEYTLEKSGLVKCYPNPFSQSTTFEYNLDKPGLVEIPIYNQLGKRVGFIIENQVAGKQRIVWEPTHLPPGVYYFVFSNGMKMQNGKLILLK